MDTIARVHELADAQDMTMYRLAQISGISMTTIRMAERRGGQLKIDTIEQICKALGITLSAFFAAQDTEE